MKADDRGFDVPTVIALAYEESRFTGSARSKAGAIGPMQILPRYFCPDRREKGCDPVDAGMKAWGIYSTKYPKPRDSLCHYNAGRVCNTSSRRYANRVLARAESLRAVMRNIELSALFGVIKSWPWVI
jgi:soluble lytic murein transglycosylase-like protein